MKEKAITFGDESRLVGVITEPDANSGRKREWAMLFWNAGLLHRVGPYRLYVDLARKMASIGFHVLRFDVGGKGDSEASRGENLETERAVVDIQCAMDYLSKKKNIREFILLGLCSGADEAFATAVKDSRVSGVVMLDGLGYRTARFYFHFYGRRFMRSWFRLDKWKKIIRETFINTYSQIYQQEPQEIFQRNFPTREEARTHCLRLIDRGVALLFIYSSGVESYYCYPTQFWDMLHLDFEAYKNNLNVVHLRSSDHIFTMVEDRTLLIDTIFCWVVDHFSVA